ncbi:GatB/YqeY domain-containing protein [Desulfoprunum benzoelyticum]|nr:GatB/YqeY domain-containing protein [Desulfoprunum benzoelyticum]
MKARDAARTGAVRILIGEFQRQPEKTLTDDQVIAIIKKLIKSERELLASAKQETSDFLAIMESYLPRQAGREEIVAWIDANIDFSTFANRMQAMRPIMAHFGSAVDGNTVKDILQNM